MLLLFVACFQQTLIVYHISLSRKGRGTSFLETCTNGNSSNDYDWPAELCYSVKNSIDPNSINVFCLFLICSFFYFANASFQAVV